ncbi:MAG: hypothetical protein AAB225_31495 [Acidobacteriota bacterium]
MRRRTFVANLAGPLLLRPAPAVAIDVGGRKQLFIDDLFFAEVQGVRLTVNRPRLTGERCLVADQPWEGHRICAYNSVMEDGGEFRMWYDAIANDRSRWLCHATSQDGVVWRKARLELTPFGGRKPTSIVFPPEPMPHEPSCVFKDTNPKCPPEERYKMVCSLRPPGGERGTWVAASPNGLRWKLLGSRPAFRPSDTANICFYDERLGRYAAYVRVWQPQRKVGRCEFDDITNWGAETVVFSYDDEDQVRLDRGLFTAMDFYTSAALKYRPADNVYLLFPTAYYHFREDVARARGAEREARNDGPMDIQFAVSRDGVRWRRPDREPFIRLGKTGEFDSGYAYMASGAIHRADEIWLYYAVAEMTHGNYDVVRDKLKGAITRAVLRLDGFMSADADYRGGWFVTPPLKFLGRQLTLNVDTGAGGHLRIELEDESRHALPGYSLADCDPVNGNSVRQVVSWRGDSDVSQLSGRPLRVRFEMRDAKLHAFQFA